MSSSYSIYQMLLFPEVNLGDTIDAPYQMPLLAESHEDPPKTELHYQRHIDRLDIEVFRGTHEFVIRTVGRVQGLTFTEYTSTNHFPAYYHRKSKVLLIKTNKSIARSAMRELIKNQRLNGDFRHIDLDSIKAHIPRFRGAWFSVADSANVSSQALFGSNVDQDLRFDRAMSEGEMNYILLDYLFNNEICNIGISDDCNVVLNNNNFDEHLELELVLHIKSHLLDIAKDRVAK